ncbi:MAG: cohesin domain-containing protein [Candidatus Methanoperedens sp.]|nr:cohesin domain-containing protein [Candidatus Methanoperedens sp.]
MISTYLRLSVIVLIILGSAAGAAPVEVSVTSDVDSIEIGQPLSINISIDPVGNPITGAQFNILFNGSVIEIENITEGVLFKQNGSNTAFSSGVLNNTEGTLINVWGLIITPGANVTAKSTFATIKINAKNTGSSILNLSRVIVSDPDSKAVPVNITNVSIITNAASQPPGGNNVGGGSSGGGGGGGGTSGENFTNIEIKEKYDRFINKDVTTSYVFKETDPILSVNITANISAGDINVAVEVLRNISSISVTGRLQL